MRGKRPWAVVRRELLAAAAMQRTKGKPLAAHRARELARRGESRAARMLLVAPVKHIDQVRFGLKLVLGHLPDMPLQVNDGLHGHISQRFLAQFTLWG